MQKPSQVMGEIFFSFCKTIDTPTSLKCWLLYKYEEHLELVKATIDPGNYIDPVTFSKDYAVVSFCSKLAVLDTGLDLEKVAYDSFRKAEDSCRRTNIRFRNLRSGRLSSGYEHILHDARRKIADVLGPIDYVKLADRCKWGPGASTDLKRRLSQSDRKFSVTPFDVSRSALGLARCHLQSDPNWFEAFAGVKPEGPYSVLPSVFNLVDHNNLRFVPKNAKTHRTIAVEPRFNGYLQQGAGQHIRQRLRSVGINLDDQSINQVLASRAYIEGFATVDFSAASDSISRELVFELLPLDWFLFLDSIRSPYGVYVPDKGKGVSETFRYEKFSSMGNAFTFELETLIFWALAKSTCDVLGLRDGIVSVYGDDVIIPAKSYALFRDVSHFCGFTVNEGKSFYQGPFYESCGKHYFASVDVTPFYQKEDLQLLDSYIRLHNRLYRWQRRTGVNIGNSLKCLRRIARSEWSDADHYQISHDDLGDAGWLVPLRHNSAYSYDYLSGIYNYIGLRKKTRRRIGRGSAMLCGWLRANHKRENDSCNDLETFGGFVAVNDPRVTLIAFDLVAYSWNTSLID